MSTIGDLNLKVNATFEESSLNENNSGDSNLTLFILWGIVLPLIASAGLVGNILTIIVLWRREMHSTTILYLRGLVITDTGILIGSVITLTPISCANYLHAEALEYFRGTLYPLIHTPGYYIIMTLQQCNVWITVSVSMERYISICHPFKAARIITRRKTIIVLITIVVLSLIYNIPHLFATKASPCVNSVLATPSMVTQTTVLHSDYDFYDVLVSSTPTPSMLVITTLSAMSNTSNCLEVTTTDFGSTGFYLNYRTIMYTIIIYVIPFLALVILNSFLIKELMTMQRRRSGTNIHEENEANLSLVLVLIVIVFIFCQTPGLISQFDLIDVGVFVNWLAVSNLLFTTNSAVNFLIYTAFGRKFRRVLLRVFRHIFRKNLGHSQNSATQYSNGDIDTLESTNVGCMLLRPRWCCRKVSEASGDASENIPLNTVKDTKKASVNGTIKNMKQNSGKKRNRYTTSEENSGMETTVINVSQNETSSNVIHDNCDTTSYNDTCNKKSTISGNDVFEGNKVTNTKTYSNLNFEQNVIPDSSNVTVTDGIFYDFSAQSQEGITIQMKEDSEKLFADTSVQI